jgi:catechol 2,3-dioxygenase
MGPVGLIVTDLDRSLRYYQHNIGLRLLRRENDRAWLGASDAVLLEQTEQSGARPVQRGRTGLYHFALLLPDRKELARTLRHLVDTQTPLSGMSDHGVSEAIYLSDPDGHGIEIYRDRPRSEWPRSGGGLRMTVDPLDVQGLLAEVTSGRVSWVGLHPATIMGHVHLHVASLAEAEHFYCDMLGFDLMQRFHGQASFVSAGGYHHHLGLNTWAGVGAPPPPDDAARLNWFEVRLPDGAVLDAVVQRLAGVNITVTNQDGHWEARDPAQNLLHLKIATDV